MLGIKLLDKIHGFWNELQKLEDAKPEFETAWQEVEYNEQIMTIKIKIEKCFAVLDEYHEFNKLIINLDTECMPDHLLGVIVTDEKEITK